MRPLYENPVEKFRRDTTRNLKILLQNEKGLLFSFKINLLSRTNLFNERGNSSQFDGVNIHSFFEFLKSFF